MTPVTDIAERAAVLALVEATGKGAEWWRTAVLIDEVGSAIRLIRGDWHEPPTDEIEASRIAAAVDWSRVEHYEDLIAQQAANGVRLVTILDDEYPVNLRAIFNRPPFLWLRGTLLATDDQAVAIVGTRQASAQGLEHARALAGQLAVRGVTVLSGLARGIDGAAHLEALEAGGRTVAVMGTGIDRVYPAENRHLARRIATGRAGALVSQFWPGQPPARYTFPMRNVVMSGMAVGTVVIEASHTSGAKMQARLALEHGKRVFLIQSLVEQEPWAQRYVDRGATMVTSVDDVLEVVEGLARPPEQLTLN